MLKSRVPERDANDFRQVAANFVVSISTVIVNITTLSSYTSVQNPVLFLTGTYSSHGEWFQVAKRKSRL